SRKVGWFDQRVQGGIVEVLAAPDVFTFHAPTKVLHGRGAIARLGDEVATVCRRPLLVTDPGIVASGLHRRAIDSLERRGLAVAIFDRVTHMATVRSVSEGVAAGRAHGFDCVVGLGGGSALAVARGVAIVGADERPVRELVGGWGAEAPSLRMLPLFSVPTTAGSGSEVSPSAPLLDDELGAKLTLSGPGTFSRVAILDPDLLASLPSRQAALSGVDALTHAIEACCTNLATPITDAPGRACELACRGRGPSGEAAAHRNWDPAALGVGRGRPLAHRRARAHGLRAQHAGAARSRRARLRRHRWVRPLPEHPARPLRGRGRALRALPRGVDR